jgi:hypothetical protein
MHVLKPCKWEWGLSVLANSVVVSEDSGEATGASSSVADSSPLEVEGVDEMIAEVLLILLMMLE